MSTETTSICNICYVTDCDTELYSCGEVEGAFDQETLEKYLQSYGERGKSELINKLAFLQWQVINSWRGIKTNDGINASC